MTIGIVLNGKVEHKVDEIYMPIIEQIRKHRFSYPDYLTPKQIEMTHSSVAFFDKIARKVEEIK
ncbi:MAG: hypothetical protein KKF67_01555 [Nanoarchaeota archaeon]|nr:hypothetical protein [Nanoarchaeota archaeon]